MTARQRIADCSTNPPLIAAILASTLSPRPELVPCMEWRWGLSSGRPIMRPAEGPPAHPVALFYERPDRINRVCQNRKCVNPYHFVCMPRQPTQIQPALVFAAEETIDQFRTLDAAYDGIDLPRPFVLAAWRNHRQLGMRPKKS